MPSKQPWTNKERKLIEQAADRFKTGHYSIYELVNWLYRTSLQHRSESSIRNKINEARGLKV